MVNLLVVHNYFLLTLTFLFFSKIEGENKDDKKSTSLQLPPCEACSMVYESFIEAMKLTAQNHFGGGDTSWEEAKLGPYATSEVRFIEVQELLCSNKKAQDQCLTLVEQWENYLEDWWFNQRKSHPDLREYLCIYSLKVCCPAAHFGPECKPCTGYPDNICSNNGKCNGSGTRSGDGKCQCKEGYGGFYCEKCDANYFEVIKDKQLLCSKCDISCEGGCVSAGSQNCNSCAKGWTLVKEKGCVDVDECSDSRAICEDQEFCKNTIGSFKCLNCDEGCNGCTGHGPDSCIKCRDSYVLDRHVCVIPDTIKTYSNKTQYLTYLGLSVAAIIVFKNIPLWASVIGLSSAVIYVIMVVYFLGNTPRYDMFDSLKKLVNIW